MALFKLLYTLGYGLFFLPAALLLGGGVILYVVCKQGLELSERMYLVQKHLIGLFTGPLVTICSIFFWSYLLMHLYF